MKCTNCSLNTAVLETRGARRRRRCADGHSFWTSEVCEAPVDKVAPVVEMLRAGEKHIVISMALGASARSICRIAREHGLGR